MGHLHICYIIYLLNMYRKAEMYFAILAANI